MTKTDLREAFAQQHEKWLIGTDDDAETAQEWVMENLPSLLALATPQDDGLRERITDLLGKHIMSFETCWTLSEELLALLPDAAGWRPISEAPKDGSTILVARHDETFGWIRGTSQWVDDLGGNWLSRGVHGIADGLGLAHPTHWKPFDPPEASGEG